VHIVDCLAHDPSGSATVDDNVTDLPKVDSIQASALASVVYFRRKL